jgi:hypothetical protein
MASVVAARLECDESVSLEDVCAFLQPSSSATLVARTQDAAASAGGEPSSASGKPAKSPRAQRSHACTWPGCGKAFSSRWGLERHARNHKSEPAEEGAGSTSFVEKRLSERLKGIQQVLEKTRERLEQTQRQENEVRSLTRPRLQPCPEPSFVRQAEAERREALCAQEEQEAQISSLTADNARLAAALSSGGPSGLRAAAESCQQAAAPALVASAIVGQGRPSPQPPRHPSLTRQRLS